MDQNCSLVQKKCRPCEGQGDVLSQSQTKELLSKISGWKINENGKSIFREYSTKDFMAAVEFIERVARVAEQENHHPDLHLSGYRNFKIELSTHAIGGLSENDFIVAAKINDLKVELKKQ